VVALNSGWALSRRHNSASKDCFFGFVRMRVMRQPKSAKPTTAPRLTTPGRIELDDLVT
jgi:hypothetical protein